MKGKTELKWSASVAAGPEEVHTATVDSTGEARGGVAFGNGLALRPLSQWDNLTVSPV